MFPHNDVGINAFCGGFHASNLRLIFPDVPKELLQLPTGAPCSGQEQRDECSGTRPVRPCASKESFPGNRHQTRTRLVLWAGSRGWASSCKRDWRVSVHLLCPSSRGREGLGGWRRIGALDNRLCLASPDAAGPGPPRRPTEEAEKWQSTVGAGIRGKGLWGFPTMKSSTDAGSALWEECLVRLPLGPSGGAFPLILRGRLLGRLGNCAQLGQDARKVWMQGLS